jgi:hypothetical protein
MDVAAGTVPLRKIAGRLIVIILLRDDACRCRDKRSADSMIPDL